MKTIHNKKKKKEKEKKGGEGGAPATTTRWLVILGLLFLAAAIFGGGYAYQQSVATSDLTVQNRALHATIDHMRSQIGALTAKLDQISAPPPARVPVTEAPAPKRTTSPISAVQDRRRNQVHAHLR